MMKGKIGVIFGFILVSLFLINFISAWSDDGQLLQNVSGCGDLSTPYAKFFLNMSVSTTETCFNITAHNITLNLNGFNISGINSQGYGIYSAIARFNITILNGSISGFSVSGATTGSAIYVYSLYNSRIMDLNISNNVQGIRTATGGTSSYNSFTNINISVGSSAGFGITFTSSASNNNNFTNVITSTRGVGIRFNSGANNSFYNFQSIGNTIGLSGTNWGNIANTRLLYNNSLGTIQFSSIASNIVSSIIFGDTIKILNNSIYLNSTALTGLNISANITLRGISNSMIIPRIMKDGSLCTDCYNFTSLNAGTVVFNVSSFSNYSILDVFDPSLLTSCRVLNISGTLYNLLNNVSNSGDNCFNITADDITIQGNGYSIIGTGVADDFNGIYSVGRKNITLKNFQIYNFVHQAVGGAGIYLFHTNNSNVENVTAYSNGLGIRLYSSYNNNLRNNTLYSNLNGFYLEFSKNNKIYNNTIYSNVIRGIELSSLSNSNSIYNNELYSNALAFSLDESTNYLWNNNVYSNTYSVLGSNYPALIYLNYNNSFGQINFDSSFDLYSATITGDMSFPGNIRIENNSVYINSTALPELNVSGNITLNGLPTNMIDPKILKDGAICTDCSNTTSLNAGNVSFTVTGFSNYSIIDSFNPNLTSCGVLDQANVVYTLQNDVNTTGTCFTITADNITLDGNGYSVVGDFDGIGTENHGGYSFTLLDMTITGNVNSYGVLIDFFSGDGGSINLTEVALSGNVNIYGANSGGGSGANGGDVYLFRSRVNNIDAHGGGGAGGGGLGGNALIDQSIVSLLYVYSGSSIGITNSPSGDVTVFSSNITSIYAYGGSGGSNGASAGIMQINNSNITSIYAYGGSGYSCLNGGYMQINNSNIISIYAYGGNGVTSGGLAYASNGSNITLSNSRIEFINISGGSISGSISNSATRGGSGGNIYSENSYVGRIDSRGNYAGYGGSITLINSSSINLYSSGGQNTINAMGAIGGKGGNVYVSGSIIQNITSNGGSSFVYAKGGNAGSITLNFSIVSYIFASGGEGFDVVGDGSRLVLVNSNVSYIVINGGKNSWSGIGGTAGSLSAFSSYLTIINALGGDSSYGSGAKGGDLNLTNSFISSNGSFYIDGGSGDSINGLKGTLFLNHSGFFNQFGQIKFNYISTQNTSFPNILSIGNNSVYINSTSYPEFNLSANITLYNNNYLGQYPFRFLNLIKDEFPCNETSGCTNFTALTAPTFVFNVSDFGAGNVSLGKFVSSTSEQTFNVGWNSISLILQTNDTLLERNISVNAGWNLIGYSSNTPLLYSTIGFTNSSGSYYSNWTSAVLAGKVQNNIVFYADDSTSSYPRYVPYDDSYLRPEKSYQFYMNESGNITIPGVYGSILGDSYNTNDLMFRNSTGVELNITDAANANWLGGDNLIYFWNSSSSLFENVSFFNQNLNSWGGYFIKSQQSGLTLIRQD